MGQIFSIIQAIDSLKQKYSKEKSVAVIWGGDFNTIPNSAIYEYLKTKKLNTFDAPWLLSGQYISKNFIIAGENSKKDQYLSDFTNKYGQKCRPREKIQVKNLKWLHHLKNSRVNLTEKQGKIELQEPTESLEEFLKTPEMSFLESHSLSLKSAYSFFNKIAYGSLGFKPLECLYPENSSFEPFFTTITPTDMGTPDYVL